MTPRPPGDHDCDVLVIGAGPSGSSCAYWLAKAGHDVVLVERKAFPREKTCGDGLTPRSVRQLQDMGLAPELAACHRYEGLRSHGFGRSLECRGRRCRAATLRLRGDPQGPRRHGGRQRRQEPGLPCGSTPRQSSR